MNNNNSYISKYKYENKIKSKKNHNKFYNLIKKYNLSFNKFFKTDDNLDTIEYEYLLHE